MFVLITLDLFKALVVQLIAVQVVLLFVLIVPLKFKTPVRSMLVVVAVVVAALVVLVLVPIIPPAQAHVPVVLQVCVVKVVLVPVAAVSLTIAANVLHPSLIPYAVVRYLVGSLRVHQYLAAQIPPLVVALAALVV